MDAMTKRAAYFRIFREKATQINSFKHAGQWYRSEPQVPAQDAAAWANAGFEPDEAHPLIQSGISPDMAAAADDALVAEHGIIDAAIAKLQLGQPGSTILVDPGSDARDRSAHLVCFCRPTVAVCGWRLSGRKATPHNPCPACAKLYRDAIPCAFCGCNRLRLCQPCRDHGRP